MSDSVGMMSALVITALAVPGWFYGLYYSTKHGLAFMFAVDFACPPCGVVHGWGAVLGFW